ncbi:MAG: hypothetical protein EOP35_06015 [Rubrivivax sp.]|nr:MAG: hypothetical protein EOP35_06015 [Rubrivivax sp.]
MKIKLIPRRILQLTSAVALAASLFPAHAQPQQTAAGAQKFLSMLAGDGALFVQAVDKASGMAVLEGTKVTVNRWLKDGVPQADGPYDGGSTRAITHKLQQPLDVLKAEGIDPRANVDPCTTRLETFTKENLDYTRVSRDGTAVKETFFGYDTLPFQDTVTVKFEDPNVRYAGPYYVAWGKATITRGVEWISATAQHSKHVSHLLYKIKDQDMADRVEFAMKFLKASCDKTASTGF